MKKVDSPGHACISFLQTSHLFVERQSISLLRLPILLLKVVQVIKGLEALDSHFTEETNKTASTSCSTVNEKSLETDTVCAISECNNSEFVLDTIGLTYLMSDTER